ncbi:hypothetical protein NUW54_g11629 [Trametes sanguinea]|uniref:Uncharacterized protein n=1 Tax=Trametes sanguinea TaxID=158606 RepID=A0ACC1N9Y8_9APHY|nr:hypothetical protein NUW54_g11629 [Trametes sanguinea]
MSRNPADVPSSATNPTDDQRRSPRGLYSPHRHTLPSDPATQPPQGASSSTHTASEQPPLSSPSRGEATAAATATSDFESESQRIERRVERSSPSASSSQGDMADTEMEAGPSKATTSESAPEGPPPKKKRTRTLTTPHQAAVLHALLAQSRFPTTQMREEVGRAIGLSARKVQNQRQKARRPRGQAATSAPLPVPENPIYLSRQQRDLTADVPAAALKSNGRKTPSSLQFTASYCPKFRATLPSQESCSKELAQARGCTRAVEQPEI